MVDTVKVSMWDSIGKPPKRVEYPCTFVGKHCAVLRLIEWEGQSKRRWQATHRHSGWKMSGDYPTKAKAIEYATRVERYALRLGINFASRSGKVISAHPKFDALKKYAAKLRAELS
jgi:hypothetical protein